MLVKYLQSSLHPKVHLRISGYTVTMAPHECSILNVLLLRFIGNTH